MAKWYPHNGYYYTVQSTDIRKCLCLPICQPSLSLQTGIQILRLVHVCLPLAYGRLFLATAGIIVCFGITGLQSLYRQCDKVFLKMLFILELFIFTLQHYVKCFVIYYLSPYCPEKKKLTN